MHRRRVLQGFGSMIGLSSPVGTGLLRSGEPARVAPVSTPADGSFASTGTGDSGAPDIRQLSQQFITEDISPWMFIPLDNIKSLSASEHPGFVTIQHGDKGQQYVV